jgi:leukotriene-A4 hydrolase
MQKPLIAMALCATLIACKPTAQTPAEPSATPQAASTEAAMTQTDEHSYAEPNKVSIQHLALDLSVDFAGKTLAGSATLDLNWKDAATKQLIVDTRDLVIEKIESVDGDKMSALTFSLDKADPIFGSALRIDTPNQPKQIRITYKTSPTASGLQWLTAEMTEGKKTPFMFSQSQAIHARSWLPLQDTPSVRFTYSAKIRTPANVMALMSAKNDPATPRDGEYEFEMQQPIPSYLLAIAAGDVVFQKISDRSGVWAEPAMVGKATKEFEDTEKMIVTAEKLFGEYRWERYDMLVLPPSFPFGGMENPRMTFLTPTVVVGDKTLVSLIAHELAHSWSGNLVTNSSWKDIWLNEGFTSYVENRITEGVYGKDMADMENVISQNGLKEELKELKPEDQVLALPALTGRDPDEALTDVAYIKGQWFLMFLEQRFGREVFDPFLRSWFDQHAFKTADSATFEAFLKKELLAKHPGKVSDDEVRVWMREPGIPAFATAATSARFDAVDAARKDFLDGKTKAAQLPTKNWLTQEWLHFLEGMPEKISAAQIDDLNAAFKFDNTQNGEIAMRWFPLTIRSGDMRAKAQVEAMLKRVGRRKLIMPIYKALAETPQGLSFAREVFAKARPGYHPITVASVEDALKDKAK